MADVTDLLQRARRAARTRRTGQRFSPANPPGNALNVDIARPRSPGEFCPACQAGLHVKCDDRMDFAFGTKASERPCPCGCFNGTETTPRAVQDMMQRQPEYAMQWLYTQSRLQGHVHVCSMDKQRVGP